MLAVTSKDIQGWAPVASSVATSLAVLLALFGEQLRAWRRRPQLVLRRFDAASPDGWILEHRGGVRTAFVRLRLQNLGRSEARDVEVVIESLDDETPTDTAADREALARDMAVGLAGRQLKWADRDTATISIPAGTARRLDLININESDALVTAEDARLVPVRVGLFAISASGREILPSTAFTLSVTVAGSNFAPREHRISVSFSGAWPVEIRDWATLQRSLVVRVDPR
jgi:hypothetical protein